jgi:hypothetical protein
MNPFDTRPGPSGWEQQSSADPGTTVWEPPTVADTAASDPARLAPAPSLAATEPLAAHVQCDECGAPVEEEQRYCVSCGAHRRHVVDPAARYLSEATARARTKRAAVTGRRVRRSETRARGLGIALALALIPAAAAVGVTVGRSSNNDDARLVQALSREQTAADHSSATSSTGAASSTSASTSTGATHRSATHKAGSGHHKTASHHAKSSGSSSPNSASASSISKPTAAQTASGTKAAKKVQKSTGKNYVNTQSGLPGVVVVK